MESWVKFWSTLLNNDEAGRAKSAHANPHNEDLGFKKI